jgi:hypothetical protein
MVGRFGSDMAKVDATAAFMYGWTLPGDSPFAGWALIEQEATVYRTCDHKPEVPDRPPYRTLPNAGRTQTWASVI